MSTPYVGDVGTQIILDCGQDVSAATARSIEVRLPDGTTTSWAATASGTTAIIYTVPSGTFSQAGFWRLQPYVTLPSGEWYGQTVVLIVLPAFG